MFLVDPIFLPGIISSDTDSKYLSGFHYPLFAIINPSKGDAFPKLAMQVDLCVFVCACTSMCESWLSVLASLCGASEGLKGSKSLHTHRERYARLNKLSILELGQPLLCLDQKHLQWIDCTVFKI